MLKTLSVSKKAYPANRMKKNQLPLHIMVWIPFILVIIFKYIPMFGVKIAFQNFVPVKGLFGEHNWVGFDNFKYVFLMPNFSRVLWNTLFIAILKMIAGLVVPITLALLLNEIKKSIVKKTIQTLVYMPHFLSWVILGGILIDILSPSSGILNEFLKLLHIKPIYFLGSNDWFPITLVITDSWKEAGFKTVIYLAAIVGIDQSLYEAAIVDGANRWKQTWSITVPCMRMVIALMTVLALGQVLDAGFEQVFNLYSVQVYESGDIIDTLVYRIGLINAQYSVSTAINLFKSGVSFILISISYYVAYKAWNYRIF